MQFRPAYAAHHGELLVVFRYMAIEVAGNRMGCDDGGKTWGVEITFQLIRCWVYVCII